VFFAGVTIAGSALMVKWGQEGAAVALAHFDWLVSSVPGYRLHTSGGTDPVLAPVSAAQVSPLGLFMASASTPTN
jgi:hypothetical protein